MNRFHEFVKISNGRLTTSINTITLQPDGRRVDSPLLLGNLVATSKDIEPNDNRLFIISGHLANMHGNVADRTSDTPGANDDAAG